ncbi:MAG: 7-carboxy-7-deazaguanine synthase QueE [Bacteroidetes bacterium]|nr:7-carboxy-7-deazaguanine synthase QueE [Bacteroidota bacterium]MBU1719365.1 7-carboxy-7-deazaguanine synthase QueE [Bacteroidota bacterium]
MYRCDLPCFGNLRNKSQIHYLCPKPKRLKKELLDGTMLPVMEEFYSLQGEGCHTGKPAWFVRIGGCDTGCFWCDIKESWDPDLHPLTKISDVVARVAKCPAAAVVVTGGEPLLYNLAPLTEAIHALNAQTFIETCGAPPITGAWDWICLSPKRENPPDRAVFKLASELKVIIFDPGDFAWAEENANFVGEKCLLYLQPEWSNRKKMIPVIVDYIRQNPKWRLSLQTHKYIHIP